VAGRTAAEAVDAYVRPLQRAVSCVVNGRLNLTGRHQRSEPHLLILGNGREPLPGQRGLALIVEQRYQIIETDDRDRGPWKVSTAAYQYALDDADGREIIAYHWHPRGRSSETRPHLHLGAGAKVAYDVRAEAHLPTNRIALEDFLWLLIDGVGVEPRRDNWRDILAASRTVFETWQTSPRPAQPVQSKPPESPS
jgi:hypothetical protein